MASSLPPEKLGELRQLIHGHISEAGVQEQIRTAISEILSEQGGRYVWQNLKHNLTKIDKKRYGQTKLLGTLRLVIYIYNIYMCVCV